MSNEKIELDDKIEGKLWDELKLLQPIIDKLDGFTFQIKNWFIATFVAISGFAIAQNKPELLLVSLFLILAFYFFEVAYRAAHASFLRRGREIQVILRERRLSRADMGPHLDRYLLANGETLSKSWVLDISRILGVPEDRAIESAKAAKNVFSELRNMLVQPRVSFVYFLAFVANFFASLVLKNLPIIALYVLAIGIGIWAYLSKSREAPK